MAERTNLKMIMALVITMLVATLIAWAGSDGGDRYGSIPVFAVCAFLAFAINWAAFIPAAIWQTEHYYDLTGGLTYITVIEVAVLLSGSLDFRALLVAGMVMVWAIRLAGFLFLRISKAGNDSRFDEMKTKPLRFLVAWTVQGLWVLLTAAAALAVISGGVREPLDIVGYVGIAIWAAGWLIEIVADQQKSNFRKNPGNADRFIQTGLWAWSRHPNYFGEIVLWIGMAIVAFPVLHGWQMATLISPVFVIFLLTKVSGIPLLEQKADERWGDQEDYESYKRSTPALVMKPPG